MVKCGTIDMVPTMVEERDTYVVSDALRSSSKNIFQQKKKGSSAVPASLSVRVFLLIVATIMTVGEFADAARTSYQGHSSVRSLSAVPRNLADSNSQSTSEQASFHGTFNGSLPLFGPGILQGYQGDLSLFKKDVKNAALLYLNGIVRQNVENYNSNTYYYGGGEGMGTNEPTYMASSAPQAQKESFSSTIAYSGGGTVNDFGTNNQEKNVDEGDMIKSDGTYGM
jgi:hypothetical protein